MIKVVAKRTKKEYVFKPVIQTVSVCEAVKRFITDDVQRGCTIVSVSPTSVTVLTLWMGCHDMITFTGTPSEMETLVYISYFFMKSSTRRIDKNAFGLLFQEATMLETLECRYERIALLFTQIAVQMLIGENKTKAAILYAMDITDIETLRKGTRSSLDSLLVAFEMQYEGICTAAEALS